jgi:hypothetical protein
MPSLVRGRAVLALLGTLAFIAMGAGQAAAAPGDIGFEDPSYAPLGGSPTGSKPESKLWFNNGWWASMFNPTAGEHRIYRLDPATGKWSDTGVAIDPRDSTRADTLWNPASGKLYVASHVFTTSGGSTTAGNAGRLYRYSYDAAAGRYSLDAGFPITINAARTETLVIDRDSTGTLWATWTQSSRVYVNHSVGNDASWGTPYIVPGAGTSLTSDDLSSLIHFGPGAGNQVGVMWSNQSDGKFYFAIHPDTGNDAAWSSTSIPTGASSDDHINLKADSLGRVFAAVKTSESSGTRPLIQLLVRATNGTWTPYTFGTVSNSHTRPILVLSGEPHGEIHMFATGPQPPNGSGQSGGDIVEKVTSMDNPSFAAGVGTAVISDAGSAEMNDATSTKQNVDATTGLVVMANNATTGVYWHMQQSPGGSGGGGSPPPPPPPPPPGGGTQQVLHPTADVNVKSANPTRNYGTDATIRVRTGTPSSPGDYRTLLQFTVPAGVTHATLRLYVTDASPDGGRVYAVANDWSETAVTWNTVPAIGPTPAAAIGTTAAVGAWTEVDLSSLIAAAGTYSVELVSSSTNSAIYSSREDAAHAPELVITTG